MANTIKIKAADGTDVEFVNDMIGQGGMKDVYFSPDKSYVVAFFRDKQDALAKDRLSYHHRHLYMTASLNRPAVIIGKTSIAGLPK